MPAMKQTVELCGNWDVKVRRMFDEVVVSEGGEWRLWPLEFTHASKTHWIDKNNARRDRLLILHKINACLCKRSEDTSFFEALCMTSNGAGSAQANLHLYVLVKYVIKTTHTRPHTRAHIYPSFLFTFSLFSHLSLSPSWTSKLNESVWHCAVLPREGGSCKRCQGRI